MKCEDVVEMTQSGEIGLLDDHERQFIVDHIAECKDCQDAMRGSDATRFIRNLSIENPSADLFSRTMGAVRDSTNHKQSSRSSFWLGAGVGGSIAAAFFAAVIALGLLSDPAAQQVATAEFVVSMGEPRNLNIAIDADSALKDAMVSITFYGGIELAGYASQRHLSWTTDLDAGVNKLSLPIIALDEGGGQVIVRLDHPNNQQEFLVQLRHDG